MIHFCFLLYLSCIIIYLIFMISSTYLVIIYLLIFVTRAYAETVIMNTMAELAQNRSFNALVQAVEAAKFRKASLQKTIQK